MKVRAPSGSTTVSEIGGATLLEYQSHLLDNLKSQKVNPSKSSDLDKSKSKGWSKTTAQHYLKTVKAFVRWLWQVEAIPSLPRVLDGKAGPLKIQANTPTAVVFTTEEVQTLLGAASDRTKLYILLMLNSGMTQKDISDLKFEEVDWNEGRIIRKRSKTSDHENVPIVNYLLWPETLRLLRQERSTNGDAHVLQNANGSALCTEVLAEDGKYKKTDHVKNAFDRLRKKEDIKKPLKSFKKTSATLVKGDERFNGLEDLFLGHAPKKMSDKHYTQVPGKLLDKVILWLETQYEIGKMVGGNDDPNSTGEKSDEPIVFLAMLDRV